MTFLRRLWFLLQRRRMADDLAQEMEAHRLMRRDALARDGVIDPDRASRRALGNVTLAIWKPEEQGVELESGASHGIALRVADVAAARAELEAKGVEFVVERDSGVCDMAFFTDPDGNSLILHRRYAP